MYVIEKYYTALGLCYKEAKDKAQHSKDFPLAEKDRDIDLVSDAVSWLAEGGTFMMDEDVTCGGGTHVLQDRGRMARPQMGVIPKISPRAILLCALMIFAYDMSLH